MTEKIAIIARTIFWAIASAAIVFVAVKVTNNNGSLTINQGGITWNTIKPIQPGETVDHAWVIGELNKYRTNAMWITNDKSKIRFGLYDRIGYADYAYSENSLNHEAGVLFGHDFGIYYQYSILDTWSVGGQILIDGTDKSLKVLGSIGKKF